MPCAAAPSTSWGGRRPSRPAPEAAPAGRARGASTSAFDDARRRGWRPRSPRSSSSSPKCARIRRAVGLGLGGGHGQPYACGLQVGQQRGDAGEGTVHRPAAAGVVGPVGDDRGVGAVTEAHSASVMCIGGPTRRLTRSPSGTSPRCRRSAWRKLATMPSAESVNVPSRSKITRSPRSPASPGLSSVSVRVHCPRTWPGAWRTTVVMWRGAK